MHIDPNPSQADRDAVSAIANAVMVGAVANGYDGNIIISAVCLILTYLCEMCPALDLDEAMAGISAGVKHNLALVAKTKGAPN